MPVPGTREIFVAYPWDLHDDRAAYKRAYTSMQSALKVNSSLRSKKSQPTLSLSRSAT